jgi:hypothetical protein
MSVSEKAKVFDLQKREPEGEGARRLSLDSGGEVRLRETGQEELLEVTEAGGEVVLRVRLTAEGPVIAVEGARLELRSTETLSLEAKKVAIRAKDDIDLHAEGDICAVGKMIYLN